MNIKNNLEILNNNEEKENFHERFWGRDEIEITEGELEHIFYALKEGKYLGYQDGEYSMTLKLKVDI